MSCDDFRAPMHPFAQSQVHGEFRAAQRFAIKSADTGGVMKSLLAILITIPSISMAMPRNPDGLILKAMIATHPEVMTVRMRDDMFNFLVRDCMSVDPTYARATLEKCHRIVEMTLNSKDYSKNAP